MKNSNFLKVIKMIIKAFNYYHYYKKSIIMNWEQLVIFFLYKKLENNYTNGMQIA
ncbi:MAG: hypothetical protein HQ534_10920 [Armatimonadetes bacterium]|nr:hypothetical protein [Armatimonadota bacterium]